MSQENFTLRNRGLKTIQAASQDGEETGRILKKEARWLIGFGLFNLIVPGFSAPFGVTLILLGIAAYRAKSPAMFVIQAVVFLAAAVSNLFIGDGIALGSTLFLVLSSVALIKQYQSHRQDRRAVSDQKLPWIGLGLGLLAPLGVIIAFLLGMVVMMVSGTEEVPVVPSFLMGLFLQLGTVVLGIGIASVLDGYRPKIISWLALILGLANAGMQFAVHIIALSAGA